MNSPKAKGKPKGSSKPTPKRPASSGGANVLAQMAASREPDADNLPGGGAPPLTAGGDPMQALAPIIAHLQQLGLNPDQIKMELMKLLAGGSGQMAPPQLPQGPPPGPGGPMAGPPQGPPPGMGAQMAGMR